MLVLVKHLLMFDHYKMLIQDYEMLYIEESTKNINSYFFLSISVILYLEYQHSVVDFDLLVVVQNQIFLKQLYHVLFLQFHRLIQLAEIILK